MSEDKKKIVNLDIGQNSFELSLRILGNDCLHVGLLFRIANRRWCVF